MATLLFGAAAKSWGFNAFWTQVMVGVGSMIDQSVFGPKTHTEGARLSDLQLTSSTYGAEIPRIYGTSRVAGNIIWGTKFIEHSHTESQGGKGGGGSSTSTTYSYTISFAVSLGRGPIARVSRVWADGKLIDLSAIEHTLYYGTEDQLPDEFIEGLEGAGMVPAYRGEAYIVFKNMDVTDFGNRIPNMNFEVTTVTSNLADIIAEFSSECKLSPALYDASDLSSIVVPGVTISGDSYRAKIEQIQTVYMFDGVEQNGKVVFKRRAIKDDEVVTIPYEDLGAREEGSEDVSPYKITRTPEKELPRSVTVNYASVDKSYQSGSMPAKRYDTKSNKDDTVDLTFVMDDNWAKTLAEQILFEKWVNRTTYEIPLPNKYAFLVPGMVINPDLGEREPYCMISKVTYGQPGLIKVSAFAVGKATYNAITRSTDSEPEGPTANPATAVKVEFLDIPKLPGYTLNGDEYMYVAATGDVYYGGRVYKESAGNYSLALNSVGNSTMGVAATVLASGPCTYWDNHSTVDVVLDNDKTLESRDELDVLNNMNAAVLGNEIIQFKSAVLIGTRTYRLSGLLRGRLGTEQYTSSHAVGERFVLLSSVIRAIPTPRTEWYGEVNYKVGPTTVPVTSETYEDAVYTPTGAMAAPLSVCHVKSSRNSVGDILVSWTRRTRGDGSWIDYSDVPLNENQERYEVQIMSGSSIKRTISVFATTNTVYTAAQQKADFGSLQPSVSARIYQLSELRGRGNVKEVTL